MSLDVAPHGRTIVFDLLGHLYTLPITGGTATQLTSGLALNRQPRYSPDGRHIVFVSDRSGRENVWVTDSGGQNPRQLSDLRGFDAIGAVSSPVWSPDGESVLVSQRLGATLRHAASDPRRYMWFVAAYTVQNGQMRWVSDTSPAKARSTLGLAFGPRHDELYASVHFEPLALTSLLGHWKVARLSLSTGRVFPEMGANVGRVGMRPAVSPNGRWLVYVSSSGSHGGLRVRDLTTDHERWLVRDGLDDPSGQEHFEPRDMAPGYAFAPNSESLVAAYGGQIRRIDLRTGGAVIIPFLVEVDRAIQPLTSYQFSLSDEPTLTNSVMQPALAPDGRRVAFTALDRVWVMDLSGPGTRRPRPTRLTTASMGEFYPTWSPDGKWIAYTTWSDREGGAVWRATAPREDGGNGAGPVRLTSDTALYFHTAISSDGRRVVAIRLDLPSDRIALRPLDFLPARSVQPQLVSVPSKGGTAIPFASLPAAVGSTLRDLVKQVYVDHDSNALYVGLSQWRWDGTHRPMAIPIKHRDGVVYGDHDPRFISGVISPRGRRALISIGSILYEVTLPTGRGWSDASLDTLDFEEATRRPNGAALAARRWGSALMPWVSWSRNGHHSVFAQGGVLYFGRVGRDGWTAFERIRVPIAVVPDSPQGTIVFRGARIITMQSTEVIENGDLVVQGNRIVAVGPSGQVALPQAAHMINAKGMTILPGYIDIHEHSSRPDGVHVEQYWKSLLELSYGVTAVRDPQSRNDMDDLAYAELERAGHFIGPRVFSTGVPYYGPYPPIRTPADAEEAVRRHAHDFRTKTFKIYYDADNTDRQARRLLADAARQAGLNATVHINGFDHALAAVIDGLTGIEHAPNIRIYDDVAQLIAQRGITYTHTYLGALFGSMAYLTRRYGVPLDYAKVRRFVPPSARTADEVTCAGCAGDVLPAYAPLTSNNLAPLIGGAARIVARGGRVGMGGHGNIAGIGFHYEMWLHAMGGMRNHDILRSATLVGARAIGYGEDLGSLEPGKLADLQLLDRNPLMDIHHSIRIRYVMKNGRLYQAEDLTEIWPRHKPLPSIYLWEPKSASDSVAAPAGAKRY